MKKTVLSIMMMVALTATMNAQDLCVNMNMLNEEDKSGFTFIPTSPQSDESEAKAVCGLFVHNATSDCVEQLTSKRVAYDKHNYSAVLMSIIKPILIVGGDIMKIPKIREVTVQLDKIFVSSDCILDLTALLAQGNINTERLLIQGEHAEVCIPQSQTNECTFKFCFEGQASDDLITSFFKENAKNPKNVKCIKLKSKRGGYRSFPKGLKLEAFGITLAKGKKGGKIIDFDVVAQEGSNYEVRFAKQLEKGDYCFVCNDPSKDLFNGQLIVCDFTVE